MPRIPFFNNRGNKRRCNRVNWVKRGFKGSRAPRRFFKEDMGHVEIHVPDKPYQWVTDTCRCFYMDIGVGHIYNYSMPTSDNEFSGWDFGGVVEVYNDGMPKYYVPPVAPVGAAVPSVDSPPAVGNTVKSEAVHSHAEQLHVKRRREPYSACINIAAPVEIDLTMDDSDEQSEK